MSLSKSIASLEEMKEDEMKSILEETQEEQVEDLDYLIHAFKKSSEIVEDGFIRADTSVSRNNSKADAEIYQDTLSYFNNATNVSKSELARTLADFSNQKLPKFKKGKKFYHATILFNNIFISKTAMESLNKDFNYRLEWKSGFLIGYNVPIVTFKYLRYKNKDGYYSNLVAKLLKERSKAYGKDLQVILGKYQLLNGRACKPFFPVIDGISFGRRNAWNFVGE